MTTPPLFLADLATLKQKLRLSGVASTSDADDIVDEAILTVRSYFYRELGTARVSQLVALPFNPVPTSEDEVLRAVANSTEVLWVKAELICHLPMMFMDGNTQQDQIFQDEALFRQAQQDQLEALRQKLLNQIQINLDLLSGDTELQNEPTVRTATIGPDCPRPQPGDTALPAHTKRDLFPPDCLI